MNRKRNLAVVAILILAVALAGCGAKYTTGEKMGYQALASAMGLTALETAVTGYYESTTDVTQKVFIYQSIFPKIDAAAIAIKTYLKAADEGLTLEESGGRVTDPAYLFEQAQAAVQAAKDIWNQFYGDKEAK